VRRRRLDARTFWPWTRAWLRTDPRAHAWRIRPLRRHRWRELAAGAGGLTLVGWIVIQVILIRGFHWLHALSLVVGVATAGVAAWAYARHKAALRERAPDRRPPDAAAGRAWPEPAGRSR
jgi:hypothetical protein